MAGGRPTKYKPEFAEQAAVLCERMAATDEDLAHFFKVTCRTIQGWKVNHEEFFHAIRSSKGPANARVKDSLYRLANGYSYTETVHKVVGGKLIAVEREVHVQPNAVAQTFWLKNREPNEWNYKANETVDYDQRLAALEIARQEIELERAKFLLDELKAAKTDVETNTDKTDFLAELATRLPS